MDTKVQVEIVCQFCKCRIVLNKKKWQDELRFNCPSCQKEIHATFDVKKDSQTSEYIENSNEQKRGKTVYNKIVGEGREGEDEYLKRRVQRASPQNCFDEQDDDPIIPKKKKRHFRGHVYLTHVKWFGLRDQRYPLQEGTTIIGRYDLECPSDISIKGDDAMSRRSVAITIEEEDGEFVYKLKVKKATNVVKVNDRQVKEGHETYLYFGDIITMGNSKFKFDNR